MAAKQEEIHYRIARFNTMRPGMLMSIEVQFIHMAQGGDGSAAMEGEIRKTYYPTWSTADFQTVCKSMGWDYEGVEQ